MSTLTYRWGRLLADFEAHPLGRWDLEVHDRLLAQLADDDSRRPEAVAKRHGALRNQLIDGLNDACYELLDDVLIEESGDGYTIYEPYYQKIVTPF